MKTIRFYFSLVSLYIADILGRPEAFIFACFMVIIWAGVGPRYNYSTTWQLVINTSTTIFTFLILFVIQNTQNETQRIQARELKAINLKLDEILRVLKRANNAMIGIEEKTEEELLEIKQGFSETCKAT